MSKSRTTTSAIRWTDVSGLQPFPSKNTKNSKSCRKLMGTNFGNKRSFWELELWMTKVWKIGSHSKSFKIGLLTTWPIVLLRIPKTFVIRCRMIQSCVTRKKWSSQRLLSEWMCVENNCQDSKYYSEYYDCCLGTANAKYRQKHKRAVYAKYSSKFRQAKANKTFWESAGCKQFFSR